MAFSCAFEFCYPCVWNLFYLLMAFYAANFTVWGTEMLFFVNRDDRKSTSFFRHYKARILVAEKTLPLFSLICAKTGDCSIKHNRYNY
ncbi:hypothetical protein BMS3Abin09_00439 [bacterium BMS3Abin09]|nr:hypothetical protein BMS3Abin09_00439 [bacterium BMS3Abin09]